MGKRQRGFYSGKLSGAPLWVAFSMLAGCNVVAGLLGVGISSPAIGIGPAAPLEAPRELTVSLRPGVSLLQAAEQAPRAVSALSRAARGLGGLALGDGRSLRGLRTSLLDEGLLIPGPLGMLEVRLEVQPIIGEAIAVVALVDPVDGRGCSETTVAPALVGAYRTGSRLLLLRADGQFVLQGGAEPAQSGSYTLTCQVLQLASESRPPLRLSQLGTDGWRDPQGSTFLPLSEQPHGDVP